MNTPSETAQNAMAHIFGLLKEGRANEAEHALVAALDKFPADAHLRFLLASLLAGRQDYEQAMTQMSMVTRLNPSFEIAHFQLGSLRMTSGDAPGAREAWLPLDSLPPTHPLKCFKTGCEALMEDQFEDAVLWLSRGIEANRDNEPLNRDMQLLINGAQDLLRSLAANDAAVSSEHLLIHDYQSNQADAPNADSASSTDSPTRH